MSQPPLGRSRIRRAGAPLLLLPTVIVIATLVTMMMMPGGERSPAPGPSNRLAGQPEFVAGVNYPWKTGQDFGTGAWGHSGASNPTTYQEIDADFMTMAAQGVTVVKWRVFSDGRYSPEFDASGAAIGLDEKFFPDLDAALEIARRHDIKLVLTLFASGLWTADCQTGGVRMGGRTSSLLDAAKRKALIDRAVVPMLRHVRGNDRVLAFEVIAEPEWGIAELNSDADGRAKVPLASARALVADMVGAIHRETRALATVESNRASNMRQWAGLGLDYYSFSWYDWLEPYEPLSTPAGDLRLDRPVVLGEFPAGGSAYYRLPDVLDLTRSSGYAGAFAWSYWSGDGFGQWRDIGPTYALWTRSGRPDGPGAAPPPVEPTYPYAYQDLDLRVDPQGGVLVETTVKVASGQPVSAKAFLYEVGESQPREEVAMTASRPGRVAARFTNVAPGQPYRISLGLFDQGQAPLKWFNELATFALEGGRMVKPKIAPELNELNCRA
jgi:hypothetical protein